MLFLNKDSFISFFQNSFIFYLVFLAFSNTSGKDDESNSEMGYPALFLIFWKDRALPLNVSVGGGFLFSFCRYLYEVEEVPFFLN